MPCALSKSGLQCSGVAAAHSAHCSEVTGGHHTRLILGNNNGRRISDDADGSWLQSAGVQGQQGFPCGC